MITLALALATAAVRPVVVSSLTTRQLVEQCRGKDSDPSPTFCTGYIIAEFDTLSLSHQICPTARGASTIQVISAARKYLRTKGKKSTDAPSFVVRTALRRAFPCKTK